MAWACPQQLMVHASFGNFSFLLRVFKSTTPVRAIPVSSYCNQLIPPFACWWGGSLPAGPPPALHPSSVAGPVWVFLHHHLQAASPSHYCTHQGERDLMPLSEGVGPRPVTTIRTPASALELLQRPSVRYIRRGMHQTAVVRYALIHRFDLRFVGDSRGKTNYIRTPPNVNCASICVPRITDNIWLASNQKHRPLLRASCLRTARQ
ncbi:hypothetical protein AVEN_258613-1, partial [Araneus ventricosus]